MIDERLEENAGLYVLGLLPAEDAVAFERELAGHAELRELVRSLNDATLTLAQGAPSVPAPAELKTRLLASYARTPKLAPISAVAIPRARWPLAVAWAAAAGVAAVAWWQWGQNDEARDQAEAARQETSVFRTAAAQSAERVGVLETSLLAAARDAQTLRDKVAEAETTRAALGAEKTGLLARVAELEHTNFLDKARIAVLGSLIKDRPKAVAVSVWNQERQDGVLVVENLPVLARGRDYQLWVIDPQADAPVSAGVFKVDAQGKVRIQFKPDKPILQADKFAITEEQEGGVPAPTMNKMVVLGEVAGAGG